MNIKPFGRRSQSDTPLMIQGISMAQANEGTQGEPVREGEWRTLDIVYQTRYGYTKDVPQSSHLFRLRPVHDAFQEVVDHEFRISPDASFRNEFYDVFDNHVVRVEVKTSYRDLVIEARSTVRVRSVMPSSVVSDGLRDTFPVVWMPWQRQQLVPFLLPPELPDSQLEMLSRYGMQIAARHDRKVLPTLVALNEDIHKRFKYERGSTTLETTPYEVFQKERGVCQDFANLLICVARLLDIPARYRAGYIYSPGSTQPQASHAWAELYLPWHGWQGFDPTSGKFATHDHVRVANGRNYRDAAPVIGSFLGDARETFEVSVSVTRPLGG